MSDHRPEQEWHDMLSEPPELRKKSPLRFIPSNPRCKLCSAPYGYPGALLFRRFGFAPWEKNPNICRRCFDGMEHHAKTCPTALEDGEVSGAEVEASMLFADVRGSSKLARQLSTLDFSRLMNRFYRVSRRVLVEADAIVEKFVGDEIVGLFLPFMIGNDHARRALETAEALLRETGHGSDEGPWVPLGAGVHTGTAFVGIVGTADAGEFTALGDPVNIAAHLASQAATGEILLTNEVAGASSIPIDQLEHRSVSLKGHPVDALVLPVLAGKAEARTDS
jgi:adenylate cyclase